MTDTNPVPVVNEDENTEKKSTQEVEEKTDNIPVESSPIVDVQHGSKESSSEPQFTDAEKVLDDPVVETQGAGGKEEEVEDEGNDSEYEDVDDEEEEEEEEETTTIETKKKDDDEQINVKPRRLPNKQEAEGEEEGSEVEEEPNNSKEKTTQRADKKTEKTNEKVDDDNDSRNPAFVPRKGKFYEHDDRTNDDSEQPPKPETNKSRNRTFKDSDGKWQHDLYMDYEDEDNNYFPGNRGQGSRRGGRGRGRGERGGRSRGSSSGGNNRDQLQIDDYIPPAQRGRGGSGAYHQQGGDQRRRPHPNDRQRSDRTNNFDFEDYNRPSSSTTHNKQGRGNRTNFSEQSGPSRPQRRDFEQYQTDESSRRNQQTTNDQGFHRERNFTNTHYQHQRGGDEKEHQNKRTGGGSSHQSNEFQQDDNRGNNSAQKRNNKEPPRRQGNNFNNNNRNSQWQDEKQDGPSNFSIEASNFERPKRYSNMRNTNNQYPNSGQQQPQQQQQQQQHQQVPSSQQQQQQQQTQIPLQSYQDQRNNYFEQPNWQRAGPPAPPQNAFIPQQQQMIPQQMYHPQQQIPPQNYYVQSHYQQQAPHQQYVPINYGQGSIPPQRQENK